MTESSTIVEQLKEAGETLSTAESITGGRLAARVTEAPGASAVYAGGVVSYATEVKVAVLGVPEVLVAEHGVVSEECARSMADGVRALLGTTYGVSTTGVAGPDTQEEQPVGTVFVGLAGPAGTRVQRLALTGGRSDIQAATVDEALSALSGMIGVPT
jgi:nicotinamide-nucleotide amidase